MSVGAFLDKILWLGIGVYAIYLSKAKKEKLGNKAGLVRFCGIALILYAAIMTLVNIFSAS